MSNDKLWSSKEWNSSFNSKSSLLFTCKISRLSNYQSLSYKQFSKATQNGKWLLWTRFLWRYCELTTLWKPIYKKYAPTQTIYTGILLLTIYYYYDDGFVRQPSFRYRLRAILSLIWYLGKMLMFCFAALLFMQTLLDIWKWKRNNGYENLLVCSNYVKYFVVFNHLTVRSILHYTIYKLFADSAQ